MNCSRLERKIVVFLQSWFVSYVNERTCLGVNWIDKMRLLLLLSPGITVRSVSYYWSVVRADSSLTDLPEGPRSYVFTVPASDDF